MSELKYERQVTSPERLFTRSPFSTVTMVARIKGQVTEEMLRNAVAQVRQRHVLLRVRIREDADHVHWFTTEGAGQIPIEVVPREAENDWIRLHAEASKIPFDFEARPPVRFLLAQSPDASELIILCHHIICDGLSLAYLARDLMVHLGDPSRPAEPLPAPAPITLENLPGDVSISGLAKWVIRRMNREWAEEGVAFDQEDYKVLTKTYWDHYHHGVLSSELSKAKTAALLARCRKEGVTVTSALTAAFSGAQGFVEGEQPYHARTVIATSYRDRLPNPPGAGMGFYAAGVGLKLKYSQKKGFWENARRFHGKIQPNLTDKRVFGEFLTWLHLEPALFEAMNVKKLGALVPPHSSRYGKLSAFSQAEDVVLRILKREGMDSLETVRVGPAITNLGRMDFPRTYGALELDRLILQPGGAWPLSHVHLLLGAVTCAGKLSLVVEFAEEAVSTGTMEGIRDKAIDLLLRG